MARLAEQLFEALLNKNVIGSCGKIFFEIQNSKYQIVDNSIIGHVIQAWLKPFMKENNISYRVADNTQEFPDFFLHDEKSDTDLLEIKCFTGSANFDVANFLSYCRSLVEKPYRLNNDYLIFQYKQSTDGVIIENIWLKKVWQICGSSERSGLKSQWKYNQLHNIRPANWYGKGKIEYPPFTSRIELINALQSVLNTHAGAGDLRKDFVKRVSALFKEQTGEEL
jgi:hypothetical protein